MAVADEWELWFPDAYEIGAETVRSFARATRSWDVPYAVSRRLPDDVAVPATMLGAPMLQAASGVVGKAIPGCNLSAILHAGQAFTYLRPLHVGDVLSLGVRLTSHVVKAETDLIVVECMVYAGDEPSLGGEIFLVHSQRETGIDLEAADRLADEVMMTGTGPSNSDAYAANVAESR
ncbi:MaoC family dehydratase N-terminal domain-containing protein [Tsukamurella sp. M9C]|uniref:FAS1-like dehydratase domain-containing protein n=1 Tax=unclassified Tsukamurella TaxID=2633480 RepID=UPI001CCF675F|nr:MaoC family dehydratase N-terminal domain-containing protein [Tsukamurella sp. M9C]MCA0158453.1 MaoC family dehydratase N-terminal domain-containing protein [Tsukamurella sp. M9C]